MFGVLLYHHCFQTIKQKVYLLLENLDKLRNLKMDFKSVFFILIAVNCPFKTRF